MKSLLIATALAVGLLGISTSSATAGLSSAAPKTVAVHIQNNMFEPGTVTVEPGQSVEWTNNDGVTHNVVFDDGSGVKSANLSKGEMFKHTFTKAGTVAYHCAFHRGMKASVVVK
jgi:plastocyanin